MSWATEAGTSHLIPLPLLSPGFHAFICFLRSFSFLSILKGGEKGVILMGLRVGSYYNFKCPHPGLWKVIMSSEQPPVPGHPPAARGLVIHGPPGVRQTHSPRLLLSAALTLDKAEALSRLAETDLADSCWNKLWLLSKLSINTQM